MVDILQQKPQKALVSMSVPISIGMLSTFLFQVIDTYFVGQLGFQALVALANTNSLHEYRKDLKLVLRKIGLVFQN